MIKTLVSILTFFTVIAPRSITEAFLPRAEVSGRLVHVSGDAFPIPATVTFYQGDLPGVSVPTDQAGRFAAQIAPGSYRVVAEAGGIELASERVDVAAGCWERDLRVHAPLGPAPLIDLVAASRAPERAG
jgi:hypothetical protein